MQGEWQGRGAELLGLRGEVTREQFEAIREGLHPETGEFLRPRHGADRIGENGAEQSKARSLYDLTFSAPKSVSIQALVGGDERLIAAHDKAVREALAEAENYAAARIRMNGANEDRTTGNWVVASYRHDASRELDPQLHTHAVAANLTYDGVEGRWKALQASGLYERCAYLTEVYRNALAREVRSLGYEIEPHRDPKGRDYGFEIRGLGNELLEKYSQRSAQRDVAIEQFTQEHGRKPTNNEVAVLVRETRADKLTEISTEHLREQQQARLTPDEKRVLQNVREHALEQERHLAPESSRTSQSLEYAKEHIFERHSVVRDHVLLTEVLRHGRSHVDLDQLRGTLEVEQVQGAILRAGHDVSTRESLDREQRVIATIDRGIGRYEFLGGDRVFQPSQHLREEQKQAVQTVLDSRDFAINLRGAAGTGKTATLQEIDRGLRDADREVMAVAPTRSAVEELQKVGFDNAMTIARLLEDHTAQAALRGKVLVVDEAGMISGRQMEGLLKLAEREHARILFSGDTRQIQSVEASDALRILEHESKMQSVSLTGVQRQTHAEYRDAIQTLRDSPEQGFEKLERLGAVREVPAIERAQTVANIYREMTANPDRRVLVVAATHEEIGRVTEAIRHNRKESGELGAATTTERHVPLQWTEAQKRDPANYHEGQILHFHHATHGVGKHDSLEVRRVDGDGLIARNERGRDVSLTTKQAWAYSVHKRQPMEVAAGDRLLLTGNRRSPEFQATNGELVMVRNVEGRNIHLEDGRTIPHNYHEFAHGYAVTAHRSQGKTVDVVIVSADAMKQELFYVAASRGREEIAIVTSDREQLRESLGISTARPSATELSRELKHEPAMHEHGLEKMPVQSVQQPEPNHEISYGYDFGPSL
ncbi:MAG: MobF family relaxase [Acidobacteriaceae bacterium]